MRCSSELEEGSSGLSTVTPVVLGDRGAAIIGAGTLCRLYEVGVLSTSVSTSGLLRVGVRARSSAYRDRKPVSEAAVGLSVKPLISDLESDDDPACSGTESTLERSSNFPFVASKLCPTR